MNDTVDPRLAPGGNFPPEETPAERFARIDPEALLAVSPNELVALFDVHYPALKIRAGEMLAQCQQWQQDHKTPAGGWRPIKDDDENGRVGDLIRQLDDFCAEVEETRKKIKEPVFLAGQSIDAYFKGGLAEPVADIRGVTRMVSGKRYTPGPGTMQYAQSQYLIAKAEAESRARAEAARAAAAEAQRKIDEARALATQEAERIASLERQGWDRGEAKEVVQAQIDRAADIADAAVQSSSLVGMFADEAPAAVVRQTTATGTTIGLAGRWVFDEDSVDIVALCLAVGASKFVQEDFANKVAAASGIGLIRARTVLQALARLVAPNGPVSPQFLSVDGKNIRAAITAKTSPLRECPGLRIYQEQSARRRGG